MWGRAHRLFLAAAAVVAAVGVQADFMVYTEPPLPTTAIPSFANPAEVRVPFLLFLLFDFFSWPSVGAPS